MDKNLVLDISRIMKKLLINDVFYGLFLSGISKVEKKDIPLAAVGVNKSTLEFILYINPDKWFELKDEVKYGVLKHEAMHLTFFHLLTMDRYPNAQMDNIGTDIEINQKINKQHLPEWGCFLEDFRKKYPQLDWKENAGRDHYYKELNKLSKEEKEQLGISDEAKHVWIVIDKEGNTDGTLNESEKNAIRIQLEGTIEQLTEEIRKSQGNIPAEINSLITGFIKPKPKFEYKKYIRNFVGNSTKYMIGTTKCRENQRFPGQPKVVLKPLAKILILIDESGSVSETELYEFLNEIYHLQKKNDIEIRAFDTEVTDVVKYKGNNQFPRSRCGGTSFTAAVNYYNNSMYNSCIVFTDGHAETPPPTIKNLLWVISSNGSSEAIKNHSKWIKI